MIGTVRIAQLGLPRVIAIEPNAAIIRSWRYGVIETTQSQLSYVGRRWWPYMASRFGAWWDGRYRALPYDVCRFYYAFPLRSPGYMSLLYVHSGPCTTYSTVYQGAICLEQVAHIRNARAILCQATNERLSEAIMKRRGYVRHAFSLGNNHYIKRLK